MSPRPICATKKKKEKKEINLYICCKFCEHRDHFAVHIANPRPNTEAHKIFCKGLLSKCRPGEEVVQGAHESYAYLRGGLSSVSTQISGTNLFSKH
jgi:hypothetical protein